MECKFKFLSEPGLFIKAFVPSDIFSGFLIEIDHGFLTLFLRCRINLYAIEVSGIWKRALQTLSVLTVDANIIDMGNDKISRSIYVRTKGGEHGSDGRTIFIGTWYGGICGIGVELRSIFHVPVAWLHGSYAPTVEQRQTSHMLLNLITSYINAPKSYPSCLSKGRSRTP